MPHVRSEPRLEERRWVAGVIRREKECDKRDNLLARRQERIQHINGEAVQLALLSADTAAQAAVLSKRQVSKVPCIIKDIGQRDRSETCVSTTH